MLGSSMRSLLSGVLLATAAVARPGDVDFQAQRFWHMSGNDPRDLVLVDIDLDGDLDMVAAEESGDVAVQLNNGKGRFGADATFNSGVTAHGLDVGDYDGDGRPDLAVTDGETSGREVEIWISDPTQPDGFRQESSLTTARQPLDAASADLDGDGKLDLLVASARPGALTVFRGMGDGTFLAGVDVPGAAGLAGADLAIGKIDGGPTLDVALAHGGGVTVFLGAGDGTFGTRLDVVATGARDGVEFADMDADGTLDLVSVAKAAELLEVWLGIGDGTFTAKYATTLVGTPAELAIADFDEDLVPDVAVAMAGSNDVAVATGTGDGSLDPAERFATQGEPRDVAAADVDGDGRPDLALVCGNLGNGPELSVLYNASSSAGWQTRGHGLEGSGGIPLLRGSGIPTGGAAITITLKNARPSALTFMIFGLSEIDVPFLGGILVPAPTWILPIGATDGAGRIVLVGTLPAGLPPGIEVDFQDWLVDPTTPKGFAASNGLRMVSQ